MKKFQTIKLKLNYHKKVFIFALKFLNLIMIFKKELSPSEPLLYSTQLPILSILYYLANVKNK